MRCFTAPRSPKPSSRSSDKNGARRKRSPLYKGAELKEAHLSVREEKINVSQEVPFDSAAASMRLESGVEEKVGGAVYSWKKRQLRIENGHLVCTNARSKNQKCKMVPLQLCMVRPIGKTTFKVVCATKYSLELRTKHKESMRDWVTAIQAGIAKTLGAYNEQVSDEQTGKRLVEALYRANPQNRICADCDAKDPTWVSISLGALICIECSGVHRSLGSHISKVRSFELDKWTSKTEMVEKLGNADVNSTFERHIPFPREKPTSSADRETREEFIVDKYINKLFVKNAAEREQAPCAELCFTPSVSRRLHSSEGTSKPTSHIGSNVLAIKTPYGAISPSFIRRNSISSGKPPNVQDFSSKRRGSMFHSPKMTTTASSPTASPRRRNSVFQTQDVRRGSVFQHNPHVRSRRNSLHPAIAAF